MLSTHQLALPPGTLHKPELSGRQRNAARRRHLPDRAVCDCGLDRCEIVPSKTQTDDGGLKHFDCAVGALTHSLRFTGLIEYKRPVGEDTHSTEWKSSQAQCGPCEKIFEFHNCDHHD